MSDKKTPVPEVEFSAKYDADHARAYFEKHRGGLARRISDWRDHQIARKALIMAGRPGSVLDVPCGTGRFWGLLTEDPERVIHACDYSQDMIDVGLKYRPPHITRRIKTFQGSAFALPVADNFVDNIFCIRLIHHLGKKEDRLRLLTELHRVTASTVIISLWVDGNIKAWRRQKLEAQRVRQSYQNRFVIARETIEQEFRQSGFDLVGYLDFLPRYAMWRTYVLKKR